MKRAPRVMRSTQVIEATLMDYMREAGEDFQLTRAYEARRKDDAVQIGLLALAVEVLIDIRAMMLAEQETKG